MSKKTTFPTDEISAQVLSYLKSKRKDVRSRHAKLIILDTLLEVCEYNPFAVSEMCNEISTIVTYQHFDALTNRINELESNTAKIEYNEEYSKRL